MSVQLSSRKVFGSIDLNTVRNPSHPVNGKSSANGNPPGAVFKPASVPFQLPQQQPMAVPFQLSQQQPTTVEQEALAMDWKDAQKSIDHLFEDCLKSQFVGVPKIPMPRIFRTNGITLYQHQIDGIRWLTHREKTNTEPPPYFGQRRFGSSLLWSDKIQSGRVNYEEPPEPVKGSILADEMGLGKTIQTVGLILSSKPDGVRSYPIKSDMPGLARCTLIVAPVSVMANWMQEFKKYVNKDKEILKVAFYQGPNRGKNLAKVQDGSLDVLIASYETVTADMKRAKKFNQLAINQDDEDGETPDNEDAPQDLGERLDTVMDVLFHRVVLDEAHLIRHSSRRAFRACKQIKANHKLCLTGTPFINNPSDIQSLFSFMEVHPLSEKEVFKAFIQDPIMERKEIGLSKLRLGLVALCLRRTKEGVDQTMEMVPKSVELRKVAFTGPSKQVHDLLYDTCRKGYLALMCGGNQEFRKNAFSLFGLMMRIRQSCCSSLLVQEGNCRAIEMVWDDFQKADLDIMSAEEGMALFDKLVNALRSCRGDADGDEVLAMDNPTAKRQRLEPQQKIVPRNVRERHPKVAALLEAIHKLPTDEKGVVYSQWTTFLDIIEVELLKEGIKFTRIDGSMDAASRLRAMEMFEHGTSAGATCTVEPKIMLCSLKAAGAGINLTRANHVFVMDCWWNVAQENQAMDRVHRIGQTRPVKAVRFVMADSIEERVLLVEEAKQTLGKGVLKRLKKEERGKAKVTALRDLFEIDQHKFVDWDGVFDDNNDDGLDALIMNSSDDM